MHDELRTGLWNSNAGSNNTGCRFIHPWDKDDFNDVKKWSDPRLISSIDAADTNIKRLLFLLITILVLMLFIFLKVFSWLSRQVGQLLKVK